MTPWPVAQPPPDSGEDCPAGSTQTTTPEG